MAIVIIKIRMLIMGIYIFVIVNNSLVSCNIQSSVSRSAITCQWRCDSTTHNHQIKNNSLRFTAIAPNCIYDFMILLLEAALISKKHLHLLKQHIILKELS